METVIIVVIVAFIVWKVTRKSAEKDVAVVAMAAAVVGADERIKASEQEIERLGRGRIQEAALKKQLGELKGQGFELNQRLEGLAGALDDEGVTVEPKAILEMLMLIWMYQLSFLALMYNGRRACVEFVDEELRDIGTVVNTVQKRIAVCFRVIDTLTKSRPQLGESTRWLREGTETLVESSLEVLNHGDQGNLREMIDYALKKLDELKA